MGTFSWSYGTTFCQMWTNMCREYDTQCVCKGQINLILKKLFGMITERNPTFSPKHSKIHVLSSNHLAVVFTSLE
jgi:hypothetical protein